MNSHRRSNNFKGDDFNIIILEKSKDVNYVRDKEEYWIQHYDTFKNGLNKTWSGKGYGHNSSKFSTFGFKFSDETKNKMSSSAKSRCLREGPEKRSQNSKRGWINGGEELRKRQSEIRKGKRLSPPKLSDDSVDEIRKRHESESAQLTKEIFEYNENAKKRGWRLKTTITHFAKKYHIEYGVSETLIKNILKCKTRTKRIPSV